MNCPKNLRLILLHITIISLSISNVGRDLRLTRLKMISAWISHFCQIYNDLLIFRESRPWRMLHVWNKSYRRCQSVKVQVQDKAFSPGESGRSCPNWPFTFVRVYLRNLYYRRKRAFLPLGALKTSERPPDVDDPHCSPLGRKLCLWSSWTDISYGDTFGRLLQHVHVHNYANSLRSRYICARSSHLDIDVRITPQRSTQAQR